MNFSPPVVYSYDLFTYAMGRVVDQDFASLTEKLVLFKGDEIMLWLFDAQNGASGMPYNSLGNASM